MQTRILPRSFYEQPTLTVAQQLIGKMLVVQNIKGYITETEAYIGQNDPACHAARGRTPRTQIMFGKAGCAYVYLIYGMYHYLNIVTEQEDFPAAVLIRGIQLVEKPYTVHNGPGKLCKYLNITKKYNTLDICTSSDMYITSTDNTPSFHATSRIGIKVGTEKLWRFVID